jgi:hypothetical protein
LVGLNVITTTVLKCNDFGAVVIISRLLGSHLSE